MSPEQAQGKTLDGRSDLYAVGVLLFHMLAGRAPFTDDDAVVVMAHHIKTVPPPVRNLVPEQPIPAALEKLVQDALEKRPEKRPQTAEEFIQRLESAMVTPVLTPDIPAIVEPTPPHTTSDLQSAPPVVQDVAPASSRSRKSLWPWAVGASLVGVLAFAALRLRDSRGTSSSTAPTPSNVARTEVTTAKTVAQDVVVIPPVATPVTTTVAQPTQVEDAGSVAAQSDDAGLAVDPLANVAVNDADSDAGMDEPEIRTSGSHRRGSTHRRHHPTHTTGTSPQNTQTNPQTSPNANGQTTIERWDRM